MVTFDAMLVVGDSVAWGQGLLAEQKYYALVAQELGIPLGKVQVLAHSGALLGTPTTTTTPVCDGEVPTLHPSAFEQVNALSNNPISATTLVLVNGGINDVGLARILNPFTSTKRLRELITQACDEQMQALLKELTSRAAAATTVIVTGYYPLLSDESFRGGSEASHEAYLDALWAAEGINREVLLDRGKQESAMVRLSSTVDQCVQFWQESTEVLRHAAAQVPNARFADAGFGAKNALFASDPWLWGPFAHDSVRNERKEACDRCPSEYPTPICYGASVGHPTPTGAHAYRDGILRCLEEWV